MFLFRVAFGVSRAKNAVEQRHAFVRFRQHFAKRFSNKLFLANVEKAAQRYETWIESRSPGHIAAMRQMMKQMRDQRAKAAKA